MTKWTPEPWEAVKARGLSEDAECVILGKDRTVADVDYRVDGDRITSCINALAGLNPEGVRELVKQTEILLDICGEQVRRMDRWDRSHAELSRGMRVTTAALAAVRLK